MLEGQGKRIETYVFRLFAWKTTYYNNLSERLPGYNTVCTFSRAAPNFGTLFPYTSALHRAIE